MTRYRAVVAAELGVLAAVLIWGTNFVILKAALPTMHPHVMNVFRLAISAVVLGGIFTVQERRVGRHPFVAFRAAPFQITAVGLLGYLFYMMAFIIGLNATKAGSAALIMASAPIWTAVTAFLIGQERLRHIAWIGLVVSVAGTAAVVVAGTADISFGSAELFGNLMMVLAAVLWGCYTVFSRPVLEIVPAMGLTFYGVLVSLPVLAIVAAPHFANVDWSLVTPLIWLAIIVSGALSTGIAVAVWGVAVRRIGASHTAAFQNLTPLVALVTGALFLGEPITSVQIVGGGLILGGLLLVRKGRVAARST